MNMAVYTEQTNGNGYVNSDAPTEIRYGCALKETSLVGNAMVTMADMMLMFSQLANDKFTQMSKKMDVARDVQDMANRLEIIMSKIEGKDGTGVLPDDIIQYMRENNILIGEQTIDEFLARGGDTAQVIAAYMEKFYSQYLFDSNLSDMDKNIYLTTFYEKIEWLDSLGIKVNGMSVSEFVNSNSTNDQMAVKDFIAIYDAMKAYKDISPECSKAQLESIKTSLESAGGKASDFVQQSQLKLQQLMQNFNTAVTMANSIQSMNAESTKSIAQSIR
jgi:secreted effector protein SseB